MAHQPAPEAPVFSVDVVRNGVETFIRPFGELDIATGPELAGAVDGLPFDAVQRIVLDLRGLTFIDSTGISLVLELARRARAREISLVVVRGSEPVHRVFTISGIEHALTIIAQPTSLERSRERGAP